MTNHDLFKHDTVPAGENPVSRDAFRSIKGARGEQCERVYAYILRRGDYGATCDEIERGLNMSHQSCSARINDLYRFGDIWPSALKRKTRSGRDAQAYVVMEVMT